MRGENAEGRTIRWAMTTIIWRGLYGGTPNEYRHSYGREGKQKLRGQQLGAARPKGNVVVPRASTVCQIAPNPLD